LQSGVTDLYYLAKELTTGLIYSFKVRARNVEGYGEFSTSVDILTAQEPDAVTEPTSVFVKADDTVIISWTEPYNRGSPLTGYKVYI
jgi:hypothetical protein